MNAEFLVSTCFELSGVGVIVSGKVQSGEIQEGVIGRTSKGKRCAVVKIEDMGNRVFVAHENSKVTLTLKHITKSDVNPWDTLYFE